MVDFATLMDELTDAIKSYIDDRHGDLLRRIRDLEAETDALKATKGLPYKGVFTTGSRYDQGDFVTRQGSLWACLRPTSAPPPGPDWKLAVKKGSIG